MGPTTLGTSILATAPLPLGAEDQARADLYALIARLLLAPPDRSLLEHLASADSIASQQSDNPLDRTWEKLILASTVSDPDAISEEYAQIFIDVGTPQVNPYGSLYLAGFMMEKPLAALRSDLADLGLGRQSDVGELEDHLGVLCEAMRIMIAGEGRGKRQTTARQKIFFERHIAPWWQHCLDDIRQATGANFYCRVAEFAGAFLQIESEAFELEEAGSVS
jgi:TorA maturation chaperone TorD